MLKYWKDGLPLAGSRDGTMSYWLNGLPYAVATEIASVSGFTPAEIESVSGEAVASIYSVSGVVME